MMIPLFDKAQEDETMTKDDERQEEKPSKPKKPRTTFTDMQIFQLERTFETQKYLSSVDRHRLADVLNLTDTQVKTWFQNRRMKFKRQHTERELQTNTRLSITPPFRPTFGYTPYPLPVFRSQMSSNDILSARTNTTNYASQRPQPLYMPTHSFPRLSYPTYMYQTVPPRYC